MKRKLITLSVFIFFLTVIAVSCDSTVKNSKEASDRITYFKDERTGICFAQVTSRTKDSYTVTSIATVDCEKVKHLLK